MLHDNLSVLVYQVKVKFNLEIKINIIPNYILQG